MIVGIATLQQADFLTHPLKTLYGGGKQPLVPRASYCLPFM